VVVSLMVLLAAATPSPIKLGAPGLAAVNVSSELQTFAADHLAQQLVVEGVEVVTSSQMSAVLGLERQKQLLGCSAESSSCMTELANALGVDGLLLGSLGKFGTALQLDVRVVGASDARSLAVFSIRVPDENGLLDALAAAGSVIARQLSQSLHRPLAPVTQAQPAMAPAVRMETRNTGMREAGKWTVVASSVALVGGVVLAVADPGQKVAADGTTQAGPLGMAGGTAIIIGAPALLIGAGLYLFGGTEQVPVRATLVPTRDGALFSLSGSY